MSMFSLTVSPTVSSSIQESKKPFSIIIIVAAAVGGVLVMALITMIAIYCVVVKKQIQKGNCLVHMYFIKTSTVIPK